MPRMSASTNPPDPDRRGLQEEPARGPALVGDRPAAQLHPRPDEDAQHAERAHAQRGRVRRGEGRAGRHQAAGVGVLARGPVRLAGPPGTPRSFAPMTRPTARRSTPAAIASRRHSTGACRRSPRSTPTSRRARRIEQPTEGPARQKIPLRNGAGSSTCAGGTSTTPPRRSWTTGPVRCSRTSAALATPARATRSSSRSSMSCPTAGASRVHRSSRSTTPSASTTRPTPQARCSWTS